MIHKDAVPKGSRKASGLLMNAIIAAALSVLMQLVGCSGSSSSVPLVTPVDYSQAQSWVMLPKSASQAVDVFFLYPTTYESKQALTSTWTPDWNQTLAQAHADPVIPLQIASKVGVFTKAGTNIYAPYYQQSSGVAALLNSLLWQNTPQNADAANLAVEVAYTDAANAFDYYLAHYNKDAQGNARPFILAAHSQGSVMILYLLERKFKDPALRKLLVAAYVIGWSVTSDDMNSYPDSLQLVGICADKAQTGCIVTYNTQQTPGDWSQVTESSRGKMEVVRKNAYSVNPLTWTATAPGNIEPVAAPASANLGALFYKGMLPGAKDQSIFTLDQTGSYTYEMNNFIGAQSNNGALVIDPAALPSPATWDNLMYPYNTLPGWYHGYEYSFFYRNLEQNVIDRVTAYKAKQHL